jgi:hypothetical protein
VTTEGTQRSSLDVEPGRVGCVLDVLRSGRIQWVERDAESDLDLRAGQAHELLLLGSSSLSITVRMRSAKSVTRRRIRLPRASSAR